RTATNIVTPSLDVRTNSSSCLAVEARSQRAGIAKRGPGKCHFVAGRRTSGVLFRINGIPNPEFQTDRAATVGYIGASTGTLVALPVTLKFPRHGTAANVVAKNITFPEPDGLGEVRLNLTLHQFDHTPGQAPADISFNWPIDVRVCKGKKPPRNPGFGGGGF